MPSTQLVSPPDADLESLYEELKDDPTLADCCRRDILEQRRAAAVKAQLRAVDRIDERTRTQQSVLNFNSPEQDAAVDDGEGEDPELQDLRKLRLNELKAQVQQKRDKQATGFGRLNTVNSQNLLKKVEEVDGVGCVCHLLVEGFEPGQQLDEFLEALAHRYPHTFFIRVPMPRQSSLAHQLKLIEVPALVCFKEGAVVGRAPLTQFGSPYGILEEEVNVYLKRLGMLSENATQGQQLGVSSDDDEEEEPSNQQGQHTNSNQDPCEICGRCYPHEHVRAVYRTVDGDDNSDTDSDFG